MTEQGSRVVTVEIHGHRYPVRSALDAAYVAELAAYVDGKMHAASDQVPSADSLKVAVLAALNIADEYFHCRDAEASVSGDVLRRAADLERYLDQVLGELQ